MSDACRFGSQLKAAKLILTVKIFKIKQVLYIWFKPPCLYLTAISAWKMSFQWLPDQRFVMLCYWYVKTFFLIAAVCNKFLLHFLLPDTICNIIYIVFVARWTVTFCNTWFTKRKHLFTLSPVTTFHNDTDDMLLKWIELISKSQREISLQEIVLPICIIYV